jgi:hypothetical protein
MSTVLFLFVMQAFLDILDIIAQTIKFSQFPENRNGNIFTCKGRLLGQNVNAKGKSFTLRSPFLVDESAFILNHFDLERTVTALYKHFACFELSMHVRTAQKSSR